MLLWDWLWFKFEKGTTTTFPQGAPPRFPTPMEGGRSALGTSLSIRLFWGALGEARGGGGGGRGGGVEGEPLPFRTGWHSGKVGTSILKTSERAGYCFICWLGEGVTKGIKSIVLVHSTHPYSKSDTIGTHTHSFGCEGGPDCLQKVDWLSM